MWIIFGIIAVIIAASYAIEYLVIKNRIDQYGYVALLASFVTAPISECMKWLWVRPVWLILCSFALGLLFGWSVAG